MGIKWIAIIGVLVIVFLAIAAIYGGYRWQLDTDKLRTKLTNGRRTIKPKILKGRRYSLKPFICKPCNIP